MMDDPSPPRASLRTRLMVAGVATVLTVLLVIPALFIGGFGVLLGMANPVFFLVPLILLPLLSAAPGYGAVRWVRKRRPDAGRIGWRMVWLGVIVAAVVTAIVSLALKAGDAWWLILIGVTLAATLAGASLRDPGFWWPVLPWPARAQGSTVLGLRDPPPEDGESEAREAKD
jgi:hypothetical protein